MNCKLFERERESLYLVFTLLGPLFTQDAILMSSSVKMAPVFQALLGVTIILTATIFQMREIVQQVSD